LKRVLLILFLISAVFISGCQGAAQVKEGDMVKVHYTGKLDDGTVFDSSAGSEPMQFTVGTGQVISGFEEAVVGMESGESKTVRIPADKAYGPHLEEMVLIIDRSEIPADMDVEVGQQLSLQQPDGQAVMVTVTAVSESNVTLDANHPLAGKDLTFEIELVEIL